MKWTVSGEDKAPSQSSPPLADFPGLHRARGGSPSSPGPAAGNGGGEAGDPAAAGGTAPQPHAAKDGKKELVVHAVRIRSTRQRNSQMIASRVRGLEVISYGNVIPGEQLLPLAGSMSQYPVEARLESSKRVTAYRIRTSGVDPDADPLEWVLEGLDTEATAWKELHRAAAPMQKLPTARNEWSDTFSVDPAADYYGAEPKPVGASSTSISRYHFSSPAGAADRGHSSGAAPPIYLVGVDSQDSHRELFRLICEKSIRDLVKLSYKHEDVSCGSAKGTLFILSPRDGDVWAYVIWAPYCLLMTVNPDLLSQKAKGAIESIDGLPIFAGEDENEIQYEGPFRSEWKQACVIPDSKLHSFTKDYKVWGDKAITFTSSPEGENLCLRHTHGPFSFKSRGLSQFVTELAKSIPMSPLARDDRVYIVDHALMSTTGMSACVESGSLGNDSFVDLESGLLITGQNGGGQGKKKKSLYESFKQKATRAGPSGAERDLHMSPGSRPAQQPSNAAVSAGVSNSSFTMHSSSPGSSPRQSPPAGPAGSVGIREADDHPLPPNIFFEADEERDARSRGDPLSLAQYESYLDAAGRLTRDQFAEIRAKIFDGGVSAEVRPIVWKFLLGVYPVDSSPEERRVRYAELEAEYTAYRTQWQSITAAQRTQFALFRDRLQRIEKDVVRTDRSVPLFQSDAGEGIRALHDVLVSYSFFNFDLGYCQGMSDVVASIYYALGDDVETFHAFVHLMRSRMEVCFQRDQSGIAENLSFIGALMELIDPEFVRYLEVIDATNFYFCFRWIVVTFKREFPFMEVLKLWDVLWTCPFDDEYQLLVAATILKLASPLIQTQRMTFDEILKFLNDMSQQIPLNYVLRKTNELYHELAANCGIPNPSLQDLVDQWESTNVTDKSKCAAKKGLGSSKRDTPYTR
ncbi:GTPase-activating protein gyp7 [Diplonema papillatum]|nr:GTPase-activating protein gyp7 [Diplonema papillatum]